MIRQVTLDSSETETRQDPEFVAVQVGKFCRDPVAYKLAEQIASDLARENGPVRVLRPDDPSPFDPSRIGRGETRYAGGVSANDLRARLDPTGSEHDPTDWGAYFGTLAKRGFLLRRGEVRSTSPARKGAYIGLYVLGPAAIKEAPTP